MSCDSDNSSSKNIVMNGLVDGINWKSVEPDAVLTDHTIDISGTSANGQTIVLSLKGNTKGDYSIPYGSENIAKYIPNTSASAIIYSTAYNQNGRGIVKISSINEDSKTISGKFNFIAYHPTSGSGKYITEGSFSNVPYIYRGGGGFTNNLRYYENGILREAFMVNVSQSGESIIIEGICDRNIAWQSITLVIPGDLSTGSYSVTTDGLISIYFHKSIETYLAQSGALAILEKDAETRMLVGNFNFNYNYIDENGDPMIGTINNGHFEVELSE